MCGIGGIISKEKLPTSLLIKMSSVLKHRGPDDEGFCLFEKNELTSYRGNETHNEITQLPHIENTNGFNVGLLHRRLSILDLSVLGHQPMPSITEKQVITFNGEIYNYKELKKQFIEEGVKFRSDSDTEVLLAAYLKWGSRCVDHFIGMWSFVILDLKKKVVFASRDRFGIKPFYYFHNNNHFVFSSEIKAFFELPFVSASVKAEHFSEFITFGTLSKPHHELFSAINQVPPGHNLIYSLTDHQIKLEEYYNLENAVQEIYTPINFKDQLAKYSTLFTNSIDLHLRSNVPVGSCLSGGLDSSAIVGQILSGKNLDQFETFTAAYHNPQIDESTYAKSVTDFYPSINAHYTYPSSTNLINEFESIIYHHDTPLGSSSFFAHWEVMKLAKTKNIKVLLNGQGADESLGGYKNFAGVYLFEILKSFQFFRLLKEKRSIHQHFTNKEQSALASAIYYHLPNSLKTNIRKNTRIGNKLLKKEFMLSPPQRGGKDFKSHSISAFQYGLQELLLNEDRNSMAFSIESRVPFLDHRLVEYSIALNTSAKINGGWSKYILRKSIENQLPQNVVWRKYKLGFVTPQREWKTTLKDSLLDEIKQINIPDIFNKDTFTNFCNTELKTDTHLSEFWRIYSVLKWYNIYKVQLT